MWQFTGGNLDNVNGETAFECEKKGDASAKKVVDNYVFYLAEAIMNFCNIFRPQAIILGGGVCAQGENLTSRLIELCEKGSYGFGGTPKVDIVIATLQNDAGLLGAAAL